MDAMMAGGYGAPFGTSYGLGIVTHILIWIVLVMAILALAKWLRKK